MKITSTKKLIIILLTLICALAVGLGVMWSAAETPSALSATAASAASAEDGAEPDEAELPEEESEEKEYEEYDPAYDEGELRIIADMVGQDYKLVNFYAHVMGMTVEDLYAAINAEVDAGEEGEAIDHTEETETEELTGTQRLSQEISQTTQLYGSGKFFYSGNEDIEEEDWFIAPDEVSTYAKWHVEYGMYVNGNYLTASKPVTTETQLWGSSNYTLGYYTQYIGGAKRFGAGRAFSFYFVWLDPGEEIGRAHV